MSISNSTFIKFTRGEQKTIEKVALQDEESGYGFHVALHMALLKLNTLFMVIMVGCSELRAQLVNQLT